MRRRSLPRAMMCWRAPGQSSRGPRGIHGCCRQAGAGTSHYTTISSRIVRIVTASPSSTMTSPLINAVWQTPLRHRVNLRVLRSAAAASRWAAHRPRTTSIPLITSESFLGGSFPTRSVKHCRSKVTICDPFATDSFGRPLTPADKRTFPGASAHVRLLVNGTQTTVASRLRFKASPWTTTTGRRNPGPDPVGSGRSAHQVSPCAISTTHSAPGSVDRQQIRMRRSARSADPRCGSSLQ